MQLWLDGHLLDADAARLSPWDGGWRLGDGVFTTLLAHDGEPQRLATHVTRLVADAASIDLSPLDPATVSDGVLQVARANAGHGPLVLRVTATRGPTPAGATFGTRGTTTTVAVLASPAPAPLDATSAATVVGGRRPATVKSTSWAWSTAATARARSAGAEVALLVEDGDLLEAAAANVVVAVDGQLATPPADGRILPGTTRALLLEQVPELVERPVPVPELATASEVVLVSAVRGAVAVTTVDGRPVGDGTPGPVVARLRSVLGSAGVGLRGG